jgi:hypothetical protein
MARQPSPPPSVQAEDSLDDLDLGSNGDQGVLGRLQREAVRDLPERPLALGRLAASGHRS